MGRFDNWRSMLDPVLNEDVPIARFAAIWRAKTNGSVPAWRDFDIPDFRGWYGVLLLTDHARANAPFCRLYGSKLSQLFGGDLTGRHPADLFGGRRTTLGRAFVAHLRLVVGERKPGLATFDIEAFAGAAPRSTLLSLPLAGELALSAFDVVPAVRTNRFDTANTWLENWTS